MIRKFLRWLIGDPYRVIGTQCRYFHRVSSEVGTVEFGCQTWEEFNAILEARGEHRDRERREKLVQAFGRLRPNEG